MMLQACMEGLSIKPDGTYLDLTFGGGGHSVELLKRLETGHLYGFDQDEDAVANIPEDSKFTFIHANFRDLKKYLRLYGVHQVDGILADLGISSHQIDEPSRGFSTRFRAELDMRMDKGASLTAAKLLNTAEEDELHRIFGQYGEIKNAKRLAAAVIKRRDSAPIQSTADFVELLEKLAPKGKFHKYNAQAFQALRIVVNDEMAALKEMLEQSTDILKKGGRLVVMSYHSLEDRLVKNFMNKGKFHGEAEKDFYGNLIRPLVPISRKAIVADQEEVALNNRARSAKLRIAEKL